MALGKLRAPDDAMTVDELCDRQYYFDSKGKRRLEPKEDVKERLGRSPDRADAWVMAVWGLQFLTPLSEGGRQVPRRLRTIVERERDRILQEQSAVSF